ncbi:16035_t:CDS:2 [Funneliformis geosporum]|nr:16035_t:CDS:2 [Funneliformis geosporum]
MEKGIPPDYSLEKVRFPELGKPNFLNRKLMSLDKLSKTFTLHGFQRWFGTWKGRGFKNRNNTISNDIAIPGGIIVRDTTQESHLKSNISSGLLHNLVLRLRNNKVVVQLSNKKQYSVYIVTGLGLYP